MGNALKISIIGLICFSLGSCAGFKTIQQPIPENYSLHQSEEGYIIAVPLGYSYSEPAPSDKYYYFGYPNTNSLGMSSVDLYPAETAICDSSFTGVSQTWSLSDTNGNTSWGKVDAFDTPNPDFPPGTQPRCRPPILKWNYDPSKGGVLRLSNDAAYALCSEKDGKTVLICISQMTDNPELAEEIFKTFKWRE